MITFSFFSAKALSVAGISPWEGAGDTEDSHQEAIEARTEGSRPQIEAKLQLAREILLFLDGI